MRDSRRTERLPRWSSLAWLALVCLGALAGSADAQVAGASTQPGAANPSPSTIPAPSAPASPTTTTTPPAASANPAAKPPESNQAQVKALKQYVKLVGTPDSNDKLTMSALIGAPPLFTLHVNETLPNPVEAELWAWGAFSSGEQPPHVVGSKIHLENGKPSPPVKVPVRLEKSKDIRFWLDLDGIRPGKTYTGTVLLRAADLEARWEIALTTGLRGVLSVDPINPLQFEIYCPPCVALGLEHTGEFSFTLMDKVQSGPYHHVRASFPAAPVSAPSTAIVSNFDNNQLSFWDDEPRWLWWRRPAFDLLGRQAAGGDELTVNGQRTVRGRVRDLSPGQYAGTLAFTADESPAGGQEASLPLTFQVRHHWLLPVLVIFVGSFVGWFSSKYVVGARKAGEAARLIGQLRARAEYLARPEPPHTGWEFPSEAHSYGLALIRVTLSQLAHLTASTLKFLVLEDDIKLRREDVERRLAAIESLRATRLQIQPVAGGRPAAQLALGRLLRGATTVLERPTFGTPDQADVTKLLQSAEAWSSADMSATYRESLLKRRRDRREVPDPSDLPAPAAADPARPPDQPAAPTPDVVGAQIRTLLEQLPESTVASATPEELTQYDQKLARLALLWRERKESWAAELATACEKRAPLDELFRIVDAKVWEELEATAKTGELKIDRSTTSEQDPKTFDLVELSLKSPTSRLEGLVLRHPLRIGWRIAQGDKGVRIADTSHDGLVQYFQSSGTVTVTAVLRWQERQVYIEDPCLFDVVDNHNHRGRRAFKGWTEWAAIGIAVAFTIATAMRSQYNATFGSYNQYLDLFIWAAGAATGGNLFSQLGPTSTPGGRTDATLPAASPGGH